MNKESHISLKTAELLERLGQILRADEQRGELNPVQWMALRYLQNANRFSCTPIALSRYLSMTRGTISQTMIALERKGYVIKQAGELDKRSLKLGLTEKGLSALKEDPIQNMAHNISSALGKELESFSGMLANIARHTLNKRGSLSFGQCYTCRHFRKNARKEKQGSAFCNLLNEELSFEETQKICAEHEP